MGVKVHFMDNWSIRSFTIGFKHFETHKDAKSIRDTVCNLMKSNNITPDRVPLEQTSLLVELPYLNVS